ncbi:hypothetical protein [Lentzea nigeriaca]|uniref:hypothetical protein n=1 Tax=Lentzea nigeriaca TaxID=1128665 RepID=UPI00195EB99D|nr:hypothetical protein [Lentzea nigeriaca]MBM7863831.1 Ca2+-binding RTX toxin-like protein [Lentzea nigeriaca]
MPWPTATASAQPQTCNGLAATQVGTNGSDVLGSEAGDDTLLGGEGPDRLEGGAGNDTLTDQSGLDVGDGREGGADRCDSRFESLSGCEIIF